MSCLSLTLICIVLQSNIALIFSAPISDCKSHTHTINDKEVKVTSHVNVALADDPNNSSVGRNPVKNHEIRFGEDSEMHIKIDISITPEMLADSEPEKPVNLESIEKDLKPETVQETLPEPMKELGETRNELSEMKPDQLADLSNTSKTEQTSEDLGDKQIPKGVTESVVEENKIKSDVQPPKPTDLLVDDKISGRNLDDEKNNSNIQPKSIDLKAEDKDIDELEEEEANEAAQELESAEEFDEIGEPKGKDEAPVKGKGRD